MVPRERKEIPRRGSVRNFLEPQDFSSIELRPSPVDSDETIRDEFENSEDGGDLDIPVTEDSYQVSEDEYTCMLIFYIEVIQMQIIYF